MTLTQQGHLWQSDLLEHIEKEQPSMNIDIARETHTYRFDIDGRIIIRDWTGQAYHAQSVCVSSEGERGSGSVRTWVEGQPVNKDGSYHKGRLGGVTIMTVRPLTPEREIDEDGDENVKLDFKLRRMALEQARALMADREDLL